MFYLLLPYFTTIQTNREHFINDKFIKRSENIALCGGSCNASKGSKLLSEWLKGKYCLSRGITKENVAVVVKNHIERNAGLNDE
jgi:hypothetical protein